MGVLGVWEGWGFGALGLWGLGIWKRLYKFPWALPRVKKKKKLFFVVLRDSVTLPKRCAAAKDSERRGREVKRRLLDLARSQIPFLFDPATF